MKHKRGKKTVERIVFDAIRKPLAPPSHPLSHAKPEERARVGCEYAAADQRALLDEVLAELGGRILREADDLEGSGADQWRWMGRRARIVLQPIAGGGELRFSAGVPIDAEPPPRLTVTIDGRAVDDFVAATGSFTRRYAIAPSAAAHEVVFDVSGAVNPARQHLGGDTRDLGMQLRTISWTP